MAALNKAFEGMGFRDVRTVLASGNVIFEAPGKDPRLGLTISRGLETTFGFPVAVLIRTLRALRAMVASDPFARVPAGPNVKHYVTFLSPTAPGRPRVRLPLLPKNVRVVRVTPGEIFTAVTLSPGQGTPELMAFLEKSVSGEFTTRNWRTVIRITGDIT